MRSAGAGLLQGFAHVSPSRSRSAAPSPGAGRPSRPSSAASLYALAPSKPLPSPMGGSSSRLAGAAAARLPLLEDLWRRGHVNPFSRLYPTACQPHGKGYNKRPRKHHVHVQIACRARSASPKAATLKHTLLAP